MLKRSSTEKQDTKRSKPCDLGTAPAPGALASHTFIFAADDGTDKITDFSVDESEATDLTDFSDIMTFDNVSLTDEDSDMVVDLSLHGGGSVRLWT